MVYKLSRCDIVCTRIEMKVVLIKIDEYLVTVIIYEKRILKLTKTNKRLILGSFKQNKQK